MKINMISLLNVDSSRLIHSLITTKNYILYIQMLYFIRINSPSKISIIIIKSAISYSYIVRIGFYLDSSSKDSILILPKRIPLYNDICRVNQTHPPIIIIMSNPFFKCYINTFVLTVKSSIWKGFIISEIHIVK